MDESGKEGTMKEGIKESMNVLKPVMETLGLGPIPQPRWMPDWLHRLKKRRQRERALSQWTPVHYEPTQEQVNLMIAQELRDWAEMLVGYAHVDQEKSSIPRTGHKARFVQHFKYDPPESKKLSRRGHRRLLRKTIRKMDEKLKEMGIEV